MCGAEPNTYRYDKCANPEDAYVLGDDDGRHVSRSRKKKRCEMWGETMTGRFDADIHASSAIGGRKWVVISGKR